MVKKEVKERNYGIDLLRIISMFFIIILHALGQGGLLKGTAIGSAQYKAVWFLEICALCAVNIFALISGYVTYKEEEKPFKISNYLNLWLEVVFYGLIVTILYNIFTQDLVTNIDYLLMITPVSSKLYWYFTAYTGLFIVMPLLNKIIRHTNESKLKVWFILLILIATYDRFTNVFVLANGYSVLWLIIMYLLGAIIKKCEIGQKLKWYHIVFGILGCYIITYLYKIYLVPEISTENLTIASALTTYPSPTLVIVSILYLIGFSKIKLPPLIEKFTIFAAPCAFSIYLLNNQKFIWQQGMKNAFLSISELNPLLIILIVLSFAFVFVLGSILIDRIRVFIFKICHIDNITKKADGLLNKLIKTIEEVKE